jgi:hypothetical protein
VILAMSASQGARVTDVSHQYRQGKESLKRQP